MFEIKSQLILIYFVNLFVRFNDRFSIFYFVFLVSHNFSVFISISTFELREVFRCFGCQFSVWNVVRFFDFVVIVDANRKKRLWILFVHFLFVVSHRKASLRRRFRSGFGFCLVRFSFRMNVTSVCAHTLQKSNWICYWPNGMRTGKEWSRKAALNEQPSPRNRIENEINKWHANKENARSMCVCGSCFKSRKKRAGKLHSVVVIIKFLAKIPVMRDRFLCFIRIHFQWTRRALGARYFSRSADELKLYSIVFRVFWVLRSQKFNSI